MSATNKTLNYELPIFIDTDKPSWLGDWNGAMTKIDNSIKTVDGVAESGVTVANEALNTAEGAVTTANNALSAAGEAKESASGATAIANNAYTLAGDAQTDAHASLKASNKNAADITSLTTKLSVTSHDTARPTFITNYSALFAVSPFISTIKWDCTITAPANITSYKTVSGLEYIEVMHITGNPLSLELNGNYWLANSLAVLMKTGETTVYSYPWTVLSYQGDGNTYVFLTVPTDLLNTYKACSSIRLQESAIFLPAGVIIPNTNTFN